MKHFLASAALLAALTACSSEPAPAPEATSEAPDTSSFESDGRVPLSAPTDPMTLSPMGLGTLAIGAAPPADSGWNEDDVQLSDSCRTLHSDKYPESYAMSDGNAVRRITVGMGSSVKTAKGIAPGASEADLRAAYPGLAEEPHKYVEAPAKYLTLLPKDGAPGLRFEIDREGKVNLIHAGEMPWLGYVEGCA